MRKLIILGGLCGLSTDITGATIQVCSGPVILWRLAIAAFQGGCLFYCWGRLWVQILPQALQVRLSTLDQTSKS